MRQIRQIHHVGVSIKGDVKNWKSIRYTIHRSHANRQPANLFHIIYTHTRAGGGVYYREGWIVGEVGNK